MQTATELRETEKYVSEDGTYIIPVTWEVYSTIRVKANNLEEAYKKAKENIEAITLPTESQYVDGSFRLEVETDDELIAAQNYQELSGNILEF